MISVMFHMQHPSDGGDSSCDVKRIKGWKDLIAEDCIQWLGTGGEGMSIEPFNNLRDLAKDILEYSGYTLQQYEEESFGDHVDPDERKDLNDHWTNYQSFLKAIEGKTGVVVVYCIEYDNELVLLYDITKQDEVIISRLLHDERKEARELGLALQEERSK